MYARGYNALKSAHDRVQDDIVSFTDVFAPELEVIDWLGDVLIPIITLGLIVMGTVAEKTASAVANAAKNVQKWKRYEGKIKDGITMTAGMAMPYGLIHLPQTLTGETTDTKVFSLLGQLYDQFSEMQIKQVDYLFNGSSTSMQALSRVIDGGTFTWFDGNRTLFDYHEEVKKMFFAALIQHGWKVAPGFETDLQGPDLEIVSTPTFLNTGAKCGEKPPEDLRRYLHSDFDEICYKGEKWYIVVVHTSIGGARGEKQPQTKWLHMLKKLPGTDVLASEDGFHGVKATDMLISALTAYERSGKQFWSPPNGTSVVKKDGSGYGLQFNDGLHSPGLVQMQVCTDWEKVKEVFIKNYTQIEDIKKPEWPCGFIGD